MYIANFVFMPCNTYSTLRLFDFNIKQKKYIIGF